MLCSQGSSGLSSPQATFGRKVKRLLSCIIKSEWGRLKHLSATEAGGRSCAETKRRSWNSQSHGGPSRLAWMSSLRARSPGQSPHFFFFFFWKTIDLSTLITLAPAFVFQAAHCAPVFAFEYRPLLGGPLRPKIAAPGQISISGHLFIRLYSVLIPSIPIFDSFL